MAGKAEAIARTTTDNFIVSFDKLFYLEDLGLGFKPKVNIYILLGPHGEYEIPTKIQIYYSNTSSAHH